MGEPKNLHFYDFGISGRVPEPQNQYDFSLETPGYLTKSKNKHQISLNNMSFVNFKSVDISVLEIVGKDGHEINI